MVVGDVYFFAHKLKEAFGFPSVPAATSGITKETRDFMKEDGNNFHLYLVSSRFCPSSVIFRRSTTSLPHII
jgi:hypothetical protein